MLHTLNQGGVTDIHIWLLNLFSCIVGNWSDIIDHSPALCSELDTQSEVQHPAVEWNQTAESRYKGDKGDKGDRGGGVCEMW